MKCLVSGMAVDLQIGRNELEGEREQAVILFVTSHMSELYASTLRYL